MPCADFLEFFKSSFIGIGFAAAVGKIHAACLLKFRNAAYTCYGIVGGIQNIGVAFWLAGFRKSFSIFCWICVSFRPGYLLRM